MTHKELYRINIIQQVNDRRITQVKAAEILKLTDRQIRNLLTIFKKEGSKGLISKKRGKRSNRAFSETFEKKVISLIASNYEDFVPTFAQEKLAENHNINISVETLRKYMTKHNLHTPKERKNIVHQTRQNVRILAN